VEADSGAIGGSASQEFMVTAAAGEDLILTSGDDFNVCVESNDCWVYGGIEGYPPQRLPDYGTIGLLRHD